MLKIKVRKVGAVRVIDLTGRLFLGDDIDNLQRTVTEVLAEGDKRLVFNLSELEAIDSAGTGAMAIFRKHASQAEATIHAVIPPDNRISRHVQICIRLLFETMDSEKEAIESF